MKRTYFILLLATLAAPVSLHAALTFGSLIELADTLAGGVVRSLGYLLFTLAVVAFFWGMVQFIWNARQGNGGKGMENGKQFMLWGLIALFVMFSVWGIIQWAQSVLDIRGQTSIVIPRIQLLGTPSTGEGACPAGQTRNAAGACITVTAPVGECAGMTDVQRENCFKNLPSCNNISNPQEREACFEAKAGGSTGDPSCRNKRVNDPCTTTDATGANVNGFCNTSFQCVPSRSSTGCYSPQVPRDDGSGGCVTPGTTCQGTHRDMATGQTTSFTSEWTQSGTCPRPASCSSISNPSERDACFAAQAGSGAATSGGVGSGTPSTPGGVGANCTTAADCASSLICHPSTKKCS